MRLGILKQGPGREGFNTYLTEFQNARADAELDNDRVLINYFDQGLNLGLAQSISHLETIPATIDSYIEKAAILHSNHWNLQDRRKYGPATFTTTAPRTTTPRTDPNAMDTSRAATETRTRVAKLTPEERDRCMKQGLCLMCRRKGHMARECPERNKNWKGKNQQTRTQEGITNVPGSAPLASTSTFSPSPTWIPPPTARTSTTTNDDASSFTTEAFSGRSQAETPPPYATQTTRRALRELLAQLDPAERERFRDEDF
jgi:hypothetical protein